MGRYHVPTPLAKFHDRVGSIKPRDDIYADVAHDIVFARQVCRWYFGKQWRRTGNGAVRKQGHQELTLLNG